MTILKTSLLAAAVSIVAISAANAQTNKKFYNHNSEYGSAVEQAAPSSRQAQEKLNW